MSLNAEISRSAEDDLARQYRWYLDQANQDVAERYLAAFDSTIAKLALSPHLGRSRRFRARELAGIRSFTMESPFGAHLIFYRADAAGLSIERVIHGARDLPRRLREEGDI